MRTKTSVIRMIAMAGALTLMLTIGAASAEKLSLCGTDWPTTELLRGMNSLGQLNEFKLYHEKLGTCVYQLKKGQADIIELPLFEFVASQQESASSVFIAVMDYSAGADVIVLRPEINSAAELKGKTIGIQTDSISLYLLHLYLKKNGMSLNDVNYADIPGESLGKAYTSGKSLAGIVSWPPASDEVVNAGGRIVASSKDFPEKIIDVFAVNRESLQKNRAVYKEFLKKWFSAVRNPAVLEKTAEDLKVPAPEFRQWLEGAYICQDAASSLQMFPKAKEVVQEIQEFFKTRPANIPAAGARLFGKEPQNMDSWFDDSLLRELVKEQP